MADHDILKSSIEVEQENEKSISLSKEMKCLTTGASDDVVVNRKMEFAIGKLLFCMPPSMTKQRRYIAQLYKGSFDGQGDNSKGNIRQIGRCRQNLSSVRLGQVSLSSRMKFVSTIR